MALWAKLYTDILSDPKLMRAERAGAKNLHVLPWLLAFAKRADDDGRLSVNGEAANADDIAHDVPCVTARQIAGGIAELASIGVLVLDADKVPRFASWEKRSGHTKPSDAPERIAERVEKHRVKKRSDKKRGNADGNAFQGVSVTRLDVDKEKESDAEAVSVVPSEQNTYSPAADVALAPEGARSTSADVRSGMGSIDIGTLRRAAQPDAIPGDAPSTTAELNMRGRAIDKAYADGLQRAVLEWKVLHAEEYAALEKAECATRNISTPPIAGGVQRQWFDASVVERVREHLKWPRQDEWVAEKTRLGKLDAILRGAA